MKKRIALLMGSPKKINSTSESICNYLEELLNAKEVEVEKLHIHALFETKIGQDGLLSSIDTFDAVVFACPLYVDSIPYVVIKTMELIARHRMETGTLKKQQMFAISNCGFPEASQNKVALIIYRKFAKEVGFEWLGGLAFSMGIAINGFSMKKIGIIYPNIRKAFRLTAKAIAEGAPLTSEAIELAGKPFIPIWCYVWFGNAAFWRVKALRNNKLNLKYAPHEREPDVGVTTTVPISRY